MAAAVWLGPIHSGKLPHQVANSLVATPWSASFCVMYTLVEQMQMMVGSASHNRSQLRGKTCATSHYACAGPTITFD